MKQDNNNLIEHFLNLSGIRDFNSPEDLGTADETILYDWNGGVLDETE